MHMIWLPEARKRTLAVGPVSEKKWGPFGASPFLFTDTHNHLIGCVLLILEGARLPP
jgi:hypothetical protein